MTKTQMIPDNRTTNNDRMYIAFELSNSKWKLMFGNGVKRRQKTIDARELSRLEDEIAKSRKHFKMPDDVEIISCYEAGRDGFWLHRYLESQGITNHVVDSSSIEVSRRYRRAKTDRIDVMKLHSMLIRYVYGETKLWRVLHIPDPEDEDDKRINREIKRLKKERTAHTNRIKSLLILHGIKTNITRDFIDNLEKMTQWNNEKLPINIKKEIIREYHRYELIQSQLAKLDGEKKEILESGSEKAEKVITMQRLRGVGPISSWDLVFELFGWRIFNNGKEVGASAGLAPTPYDSGDSQREQGISKAGNKRVRSTMIELAWSWVRYQPQSLITRWFEKRFAKGGKRIRRIGIVAVARKLLIALWRFVEQGVVPEGAILKA